MKASVPICAVCNRQVDRFEQWTEAESAKHIFIARCHGETQRVELTARQLEEAGRYGISLGRAFETLKLEN